jgi:hypothetical protein
VVKGRLPLERAPLLMAAMQALLVFAVLLMAAERASARTYHC